MVMRHKGCQKHRQKKGQIKGRMREGKQAGAEPCQAQANLGSAKIAVTRKKLRAYLSYI